MASKSDDESAHVKKRNKMRKKFISFDEEVVSKDAAQEILAKEKEHNLIKDTEQGQELEDRSENGTKSKSRKLKKRKQKEESNSNIEFAFAFNSGGNEPLETDQCEKETEKEGNEEGNSKKKKKKRKNVDLGGLTVGDLHIDPENEVTSKDKPKKTRKKLNTQEVMNDDVQADEEDEANDNDKPKKRRKKQDVQEPENQEDGEKSNKPESKKTESIRERKRKKYAELLKEKKLKTELVLQQKSLNYLSKWKHSRSEWKFEKLRQIWLQQSMYDSSKVPSEFWETVIEYFGNSKGKAREVILKEALKIIEQEENVENNEETESSIKFERARDIIQHLQE